MELVVVIIGIGLLVGLIVRDKGDNTMDTLGKGCGCLILLSVLFTIMSLLMNNS